MAITLDATTLAEYRAGTTADLRAQAVINALSGTVTVKVYDGSDNEKGSGTISGTWATRSGSLITVGEVASFAVTSSGTPDANWYLKISNGTRYVRGSFGLTGSGQDFTWSLPTWSAGNTGSLGTITLTALGNSAPVWSGTTNLGTLAVGATVNLAQYASDADGNTLRFALVSCTLPGVSVSETGTLTLPAQANSDTYTLVVSASDGIAAAVERTFTFAVATAYVPVWSQNFDSFANGASLAVASAFADAGRTVADTNRKYGITGASAKMSIRVGDGGAFGSWGGIRHLPRPYVRGEELWVRWRQYWPSSFAFTATPAMKFLRFRCTDAQGNNPAHMDLYTNYSSAPYSTISENAAGPPWWEDVSAPPIPRDRWVTYEAYVRLDTVSVDNGGNGRYRLWIDGVCVHDRTSTNALGQVDGRCVAVYWFTYWNNENPPDNDPWVDDIVIASSDSPPTSFDAQGRRFIGV